MFNMATLFANAMAQTFPGGNTNANGQGMPVMAPLFFGLPVAGGAPMPMNMNPHAPTPAANANPIPAPPAPTANANPVPAPAAATNINPPTPAPAVVPNAANTAPTAPRRPRAAREKKVWVPPSPPGPTLRQRVERMEREAGLRCYSPSCGAGPNDDDPYAEVYEGQLSIQPLHMDSESKGKRKEASDKVCEHTFHGSCLVSAQRVAMSARGEDVEVDIVNDADGEEQVVVSCPVCRADGCVGKMEWEEGVRRLEV